MVFNRSSILRNDTLRVALRNASDLVHPRAAAWRRQIEKAYNRGEWELVARVVPQAMKVSITLSNPGNYLRLAQAQARLKRPADAAQTLEAGIVQYPWSQVLLRGAAELAMSRGEFGSALRYWQRALDAPEQQNDSQSRVRNLPRHGSDFDWYELAWQQIAQGWEGWWDQAGVRPLPVTYSRVFKVLQTCGELDLAREIALQAIREYPENEGLLLQMLPSLAERDGNGGIASAFDVVLTELDAPVPGSFVQRLREADKLIDDLARRGPTDATQLRIVTVRKHSSYEAVVRAGNFWDEERIRRATRRLAERDDWPERNAENDRLSDAAWLVAKRFARGRGGIVGVDDTSLAQSLFHLVKHEIVMKLPVDRLAEDIFRESGQQPVLLELNSLTLRYLSSYPGSRMHVFYLYDALRKLGANVQLVHAVRAVQPKGVRRLRKPQLFVPTLYAVPQVTELRPRPEPLEEFVGSTSSMLVPSGIRSVTRVLNHIAEPPLIVNAGASLPEFAYDSTKKHVNSYDLHAHVHPKYEVLTRFSVETSVQDTWVRVDPVGDAGDGKWESGLPGAWLSTGTVDTSDWNQWLADALLPYFSELVEAADALIETHGITDVHIGDYLYAEPSLIADRVRAHGGRVHLWPHSSNPVHVKYHDTSKIASIHCVTESGVRIWKAAAPDTEVVHEPALMIANKLEPVEWQDGEPLSLVVVGGRPVLRNLPILAIEKHEQTYRDFFNGLQPLVDSGLVRVYFKPRGRSGEHEAWLEEIVGRAAGWQRELAHPTRLELPNAVFASISVGSSALLEGVARGIPGLIVKENLRVRDYISTERGGFEILEVGPALEFLQSLSSRDRWESVRSAQRRDLAEELGIPRSAVSAE